MKGNIIETMVGAVVLCVAIGFIVFAYSAAGTRTASGYQLRANFNNVDGLALGADVRLSGIKVGSVTEMMLDPESYEAAIVMTIYADVKLYEGTAAKITSSGLLGNQYISLDPGGGLGTLTEGGEISYTTGSVDLMGLISKFIFSSGEGGDDKGKK